MRKLLPYLSPLASGLLLFLAFSRMSLGALAWIAFLPLLWAIREAPPWRAALLGLGTGGIFYGFSLSWVTHAMVVYGGLSRPLSVLVLIALALYLALYFGLFSFLCAHFHLLSDLAGLFFLPALWVSLELVRNYLLSGFPWNLLGYSQVQNLPLLQLASLTGIYGLSFLVVLVNAAIVIALLPHSRPGRAGKALVIVGVALTLAFGHGFFRLYRPAKGGRITVAVVQGNIEQSLKWDPARQQEALRVHQRLTREAAAAQPDLIVWPETAVAFYLRYEKGIQEGLESLARETRAYLLVGSPDVAREGETQYFNAAFLLSPRGEPPQKYDKIHLVPFGEYVPLRRLLPFVDKLVVGIGDFSAGREAKVFALPTSRFGVMICFEAIFPELARELRRRGADYLVNVTNDAWFGRTAGPYQHLSMAVVRAVENGCYLVRAANTGVSAVINSRGEILQASSLFTEDRFAVPIAVSRELTLYARWGDVFAQGCLLLTLAFVVSRSLPGGGRSGRGEPRRGSVGDQRRRKP